MTTTRTVSLTALLLLLGACASTPQTSAELQSARIAVAQAEQSPEVARDAPETLAQARERLRQAEAAAQARNLDQANHYAYLARQHALAAQMQARQAAAQRTIEGAEQRTAEARLQARERQIERFQAELEEQRRATAEAQAELGEAEAQLAEMQPRATERGLVLTLDEMHFAFDSARLQPGSEQSIQRLARYLLAHPDQQALIEGHTDSVGDASYNAELSARRAEAVREALIAEGIDAQRMEARGLGEEIPVASNETAAGRAQNRRVEVIVAAPRAADEEQVAEAESEQEAP